MTSIDKSTVKALLVLVVITAGMGISVFSTVKDTQANTNQLKKTSLHSDSKKRLYHPKSQYEKKIHRELSMLIPGSKKFNPRFLNFILANNSQK